MRPSLRTAVAAIAANNVRRQAIDALSVAGPELIAVADNAADAMDVLHRLRPDMLLADAELPLLDGASLAERVLGGFRLPVRPKLILLRYPEFPVRNEDALAEMGAVLVEKPIDTNRFRAAIRKLEDAPPVFSPAVLRKADSLLDELGVPEHMGRLCLRTAVLICAADERYLHSLGGMLYPEVGRICRLEDVQVERAMRHAISLAWQSDKLDNQYRIFADTVDAGRGQPTCGEMISRLADILRLEG